MALNQKTPNPAVKRDAAKARRPLLLRYALSLVPHVEVAAHCVHAGPRPVGAKFAVLNACHFPVRLPRQNAPLVCLGRFHHQPLLVRFALCHGVSGAIPLLARVAAVMLFRCHDIVGKNSLHFSLRAGLSPASRPHLINNNVDFLQKTIGLFAHTSFSLLLLRAAGYDILCESSTFLVPPSHPHHRYIGT